MPRQRSINRNDLISNALQVFWRKGYAATSVGDLVDATGVGRGALYTDFDGKKSLFLSCLDVYSAVAVGPAFARVEADGASLEDIAKFLDTQIDGFFLLKPPIPGCLMANTLSEEAVHDSDIREVVAAHYDRLRRGFQKVIMAETSLRDIRISQNQLISLAEYTTLSVQGLWAYGRLGSSKTEMHKQAHHIYNALDNAIESYHFA